ncbi:helix-turn-helix transcriptional regulator [Shewanella sp. 10N.286.48.A6]|uniref:helix-turn-helix transcriptional regulator n=1 Tax=Shewanella sp. 10N.286.48.A6 TaxID=1880833 RepID=UPI000C826077|nr:AraC family transcriptional regulator [Shewanella sp. 10N.286.48.A6]PMI01774.1 AraC family transcriptional regulator [Shewanella sp. 10N.286.48.A6]
MQRELGYKANMMVGDQCYPAFELRNLLNFIELHLGDVVATDIYLKIGLGPQELNAMQFVYVWQVEYAMEVLRTTSPDPEIGARLGASYQIASLDVLLPFFDKFTTLNQCLLFVIKNPDLAGSFADTVIRFDETRLWVRWLNTGKANAQKFAFQFQHSVCALLGAARQLVASTVVIDEIHMAEPQCNTEFLSAETGAKIVFDCDFYEWGIDIAILNTPLSYQFDHLALAASVPDGVSFIEPLLTDIRLCMPKPPKLEQLAEKHHMSARSLRRKLSAAGTSYQKLVDQVRCQAAINLILANELSAEDISEVLGYGDVSHFRQSFKHWLGYPPGHFLKLNLPS